MYVSAQSMALTTNVCNFEIKNTLNKDLFDNLSHSTLHPDVLKIRKIIFCYQFLLKKT